MKNQFSLLKLALLAVTLATLNFKLSTLNCRAALGYDTFNPNRGIAVGPTVALNTIGTALYTNAPIDKLGLTGVGALVFQPFTNAGNAVLTAQIFTSIGPTNSFMVQYTNFAQSVQNAVTITNTYWGTTNVLLTNQVIAAGTFPSAIANVALTGYATPNLVYAPATNQIVYLSTDYPVWAQVNLDDVNRYIWVVYTVSGGTGATNDVVGCQLIGTTSSPGY